MIYDCSLSYHDNETMPLGGTQSSFIELVNAFRDLGHQVNVYTNTEKRIEVKNLIWDDLSSNIKYDFYDLMIVNVSPWLFEKYKDIKVGRKVLWVHNEAKYLLYWKRFKYIIKHWPTIVFSGKYHRSTFPWFFPSPPKKIIELGLSNVLFSNAYTSLNAKGNKKVFFTSNPLRSLDWLVDVWVNKIHPNVPDAELHIFSGWKTYGNWGLKVKPRMDKVLNDILLHKDKNIIVRDPIPKNELFEEMKFGRAIFYRGDKSETFCLAIAEAQALGLPAVVCDKGSMKERVDNKITGYVVSDSKEEFAEKCIQVLTDNQLWLSFHSAAIIKYKSQTWQNAARQFIKLH